MVGDPELKHKRLDQKFGYCRFADPAESQRGERDAELGCRQIGVKAMVHLQRISRQPVPFSLKLG
ncbi:hypothetical protein D3C73_1407360 [compost metagenome]